MTEEERVLIEVLEEIESKDSWTAATFTNMLITALALRGAKIVMVYDD